MRNAKPFHFVKLGDRYVNMALVTDIKDAGTKVTIYLAAPMLGRTDVPVTGGRRLTLKDPEVIADFRRWMTLND